MCLSRYLIVEQIHNLQVGTSVEKEHTATLTLPGICGLDDVLPSGNNLRRQGILGAREGGESSGMKCKEGGGKL